ncbi:MAG: two-component sensor [Gammaproteobacteria bacterium]|nr:MAG: two-component sensor [Gammaproteobacteria bacterium]TND06721.1 MAG: two-component sensor [Gammaproteobacteria bacterium]
MSQTAVANKRELENAFRTFNQVSEQLAASYHALEEQVRQLTAELAHAQDQRIQQLSEKERIANRLERLLDALPAGVVVLDGRGVVRDANSAARRLLGEPLLGLFWLEVINRAFSSRLGDFNEVLLKDGRVTSISTNPLGSEPGQIVLLNDITETCSLQEKLGRHQRLSAMGEMAASLAHQIRTPLASALLYAAQTGSEKLDGDRRKRLSERLLAGLRQLEHMVNDMLLFARGGGAGTDVIAIDGLLGDLQQNLDTYLRDGVRRFTAVDETRGAVLTGNRNALMGALQNLVINALQAADGNVSIQVIAVRNTDKSGQPVIDISVTDNGPGIAAEVRDRIFEPFFTTRSQGTGLGLAVVEAVAHMHNGAVWMTPANGGGATFTIRVPFVDAHADGEAQLLELSYAERKVV